MGLPAMSPARKEPDLSTYSGRLSKRLRELREKNNLTTEQVANMITAAGYKTTAANIRHWENGTGRPNLDALPYLAEVFGLRTSKLFPD